MLKKAIYLLDHLEEYIIIALFTAILLILGSGVITRYIFSYTPSWAEQLARIFFVWVSFAGISLAARHGMHLRVTAINLILPKRIGKLVLLVGDLIASVVAFTIGYRILLLTISIYHRGQTFAAMTSVPVWVMYVAGALGMIGMGVRLVQTGIIPTILEFVGKRNGSKEKDSDQNKLGKE